MYHPSPLALYSPPRLILFPLQSLSPYPTLSPSPLSISYKHITNATPPSLAYIDVLPSTTGGGTNFPLLNAPLGSRGDRWCEFVDCDTPYESGVTFRPLPGNAIFWRNLNEDGSGDERTLHAGLPVTSGGKVGMNIWTREGGLAKEFRGED